MDLRAEVHFQDGHTAKITASDVSDGHHTFKELYFHRMVLFAAVLKAHREKAWKSKKHNDGTMYDDYFVVGVETPEGSFSYHYHVDYWSYFDCREVAFAPPWDGHTPEDVERLLLL